MKRIDRMSDRELRAEVMLLREELAARESQLRELMDEPVTFADWLSAVVCRVTRHRWRAVYQNPWSQHPVSVTRETQDDIEIRVRCRRCGIHGWV